MDNIAMENNMNNASYQGAIDDHPRAAVLCFDQKAKEDIKPRHYQSGFEIHKINISLFRLLIGDDFINKINALTGLTIGDRAFVMVDDPEALGKIKTFVTSKSQEGSLDKNLRSFYRILAHFCTYSIENGTGFVFDF